MTLEELIIGLVRLLGSLPVLRWAFIGSLVAVLVDFSDLFMMNLLDFGGVRNYQLFDKWVDLAYMITFLVVSMRWSGVERRVALGLFGYRLVGLLLFETVGWRGFLLIFPNVFEFWFIFVAGVKWLRPGYTITAWAATKWMVPILILKESQEYTLHWWRILDQYRAVDVVKGWWAWIIGWFSSDSLGLIMWV